MILYVLSMRKTLHLQDICDSGVVGNARPCQGRDRGFEPRLSLLRKGIMHSMVPFFDPYLQKEKIKPNKRGNSVLLVFSAEKDCPTL